MKDKSGRQLLLNQSTQKITLNFSEPKLHSIVNGSECAGLQQLCCIDNNLSDGRPGVARELSVPGSTVRMWGTQTTIEIANDDDGINRHEMEDEEIPAEEENGRRELHWRPL
ncbi:hypothetical protein H6P81_020618 [Aristolochia fimbriata]|uniref:Uncharacterized protein n=1 Tax=Aristolochia fimbriata TaxID=158543 RepID=A0AAV7DV35_ARIFI|nr:hypothetical protein H6P81_020618 [Aristolochia fimbriata]